MALGAQLRDVLQLVVKGGLVLSLIGVAIGIAGALALTRLLRTLLFGVTPTDAVTFIAVSVTLDAVGQPGAPGYQPPYSVLLCSDVALRNTDLWIY